MADDLIYIAGAITGAMIGAALWAVLSPPDEFLGWRQMRRVWRDLREREAGR